MSAEIHPSIQEFIKDVDGEYSHARLLSTVRALQQEGKKTRSITRALFKTLLMVSFELDTPAHRYSLMEHCREVMGETMKDLDDAVDEHQASLSTSH